MLAAAAFDDEETAVELFEPGDVTPEFFELCDRVDVFLAAAPKELDVFDGDVCGHTSFDSVEGVVDFCGSGGIAFCGEDIIAREAKGGEKAIDVNPVGERVVEGEFEFVFFAWECESFDELDTSVHAGEAAAFVFVAAGCYFEVDRFAAGVMHADHDGAKEDAEGIGVVDHEVEEVGIIAEQGGEGAIAEHVGDFEEVAGGIKALEGDVFSVILAFAAAAGPFNVSGTEIVLDFLSLFVEFLLGELFPEEAEVAFHGVDAVSYAEAAGEIDGTFVAVIIGEFELTTERFVGEETCGEDMLDRLMIFVEDLRRLAEMDFGEAAVTAAHHDEGVDDFDDGGAFGPAAAEAATVGDDGDSITAEQFLADLAVAKDGGVAEVIRDDRNVAGLHILDDGGEGEAIFTDADGTAFKELLVTMVGLGIEAVFAFDAFCFGIFVACGVMGVCRGGGGGR